MSWLSDYNKALVEDPEYRVWLESVTADINEYIEYDALLADLVAIGNVQLALGENPNYRIAFREFLNNSGISYFDLDLPNNWSYKLQNDFERHFLRIIWDFYGIIKAGKDIAEGGGDPDFESALSAYMKSNGITYDQFLGLPHLTRKGFQMRFQNYFEKSKKVTEV